VRGLRLHLAGSAVLNCSGDLLSVAHLFVARVVREVIEAGGGLVLGAGAEPRGEAGEPCIFDWTGLREIAQSPDPGPEWPEQKPERHVVVASQRGLEKVPDDRLSDWDACRQRSDFGLEVAPPGWRMAGIIRERQVLRGDVLLGLGGGAGVEHLAELYRDEGKPIIPIDTELGALNDDGNGGSRYLHQQALTNPTRFFRVRDSSGNAAARLLELRLDVNSDPVTLAQAAVELLRDLRPRTAFYARLLDTTNADYPSVEDFFRKVVDPVVVEQGFTPKEMGRGRPEAAFMNVEIFQGLHRAGAVVVDLTGVRPNCTMELGYALARRRRVVITARKGTVLPFDEDKLPTYLWDERASLSDRVGDFRDWFDRYAELPPLVE